LSPWPGPFLGGPPTPRPGFVLCTLFKKIMKPRGGDPVRFLLQPDEPFIRPSWSWAWSGLFHPAGSGGGVGGLLFFRGPGTPGPGGPRTELSIRFCFTTNFTHFCYFSPGPGRGLRLGVGEKGARGRGAGGRPANLSYGAPLQFGCNRSTPFGGGPGHTRPRWGELTVGAHECFFSHNVGTICMGCG